MYVLFKNRHVELKPTKEIVLYVARGTKQKIDILNKSILGNKEDDCEHELCAVRDYLVDKDKINDTAIVVAGSIEVKRNSEDKENDIKEVYDVNKNKSGNNHSTYSEFDGIIIYPYRRKSQILFLEAKNKKKKNCDAIQCLKDKFEKLKLQYINEDIQLMGKDCYYEYSL